MDRLQNKYTNYKGIKITPILDKLLEYKRNWIQHVNRMPCNRLPRVMKHYSPTGRRNHDRSLKRLLDTWDRNGSTSGPTPWQIYDDDDDDDDDDEKPAVCLLPSVRLLFLSFASHQVCYPESLSSMPTEQDLLSKQIANISLLPRAAVRIQDSKDWERAIYLKVSGREKRALRRCLRIL